MLATKVVQKYGDKKLRQRAKKLLRATLIDPSGTWQVDGGEFRHFVRSIPDGHGGFDYQCDCGTRPRNYCSHVIAVAHYLEPELSYKGKGVQDK